MNRPRDRQCIETAVSALDRIADANDAATEQALDAARRQALQGPNRMRPLRLLSAAAAAAVLLLAAGIAFVDRNGGELAPLTEQLAADAELYQEMEFYLWLSEELESQ
jgi:hypothetical protein